MCVVILHIAFDPIDILFRPAVAPTRPGYALQPITTLRQFAVSVQHAVGQFANVTPLMHPAQVPLPYMLNDETELDVKLTILELTAAAEHVIVSRTPL